MTVSTNQGHRPAGEALASGCVCCGPPPATALATPVPPAEPAPSCGAACLSAGTCTCGGTDSKEAGRP